MFREQFWSGYVYCWLNLMTLLNEQEEKVIDKIIAAIVDCISLEAIQTIPVPASGMSFK